MNLSTRIHQRLSLFRSQWLRWRPGIFVIEPTNHCNLRCRMCPEHGHSNHAGQRSRGFMNPALHRNIVEQISRTVSRGVVVAHGAGEPLAHPQFLSLLENIRRVGNLDIAFLTNARLLTREQSQQILNIGVQSIGFSINGLNAEMYRKICGCDAWTEVQSNIQEFIELAAIHYESGSARRPRIQIQIIETHDQIDLIEPFVESWLTKVDEIVIQKERDSSGRRFARDESVSTLGVKSFQPCHRLIQPLTVSWDGKVHLCCEDWAGEVVLGDFNQQTYSDILVNLRQYLFRHRTFRKNSIHLCNGCVAPLERRVVTRSGPGRKIIESPLWKRLYRKSTHLL